MSRLRPSVVLYSCGSVLAAAFALLPWCRNHHYLRDFYDYGLVMSAVGRIAAGEHAYVDFVTPIQTGIFIFNGWAERLGGGTFQAMTWGAAALTVLSVVLLIGIYERRWPRVAAVGLGGAITWLTASQHTIIWHNTVGALCIAVVAWSAAAAPVLRGKDWPWHLLTALALVVGGITKLNSQLVAVGSAGAWALWAGFSGRSRWPRVLATIGFILVGGAIVPVALELAWTQAPFATWWYNVVELPFGHRTGDLAAMLQWKFYFTTRHVYYGVLPLPPLGAVGVAVTAAFAVAGVRARGRRQAGWVIGAALYAAASGAALLATNYEIAYVAMGAWFALVAALWLGFSLPVGGRCFYGTLVLPALLVGVLAWQSAWVGQRSQFGYAKDPKLDYVDGGSTAPDYRYMRGTLLPPGMADSMAATADWHRHLSLEERRVIFYGPGLEWLERVWPTSKLRGMPLWMHGGTSYGAREDTRLSEALSASGSYRYILVPEARDYWDAPIADVLAARYFRRHTGSAWFIYTKLPPGVVSWRPLDFLPAFGGNVNSTCLESTMKMWSLADGRTFIGIDHGMGEMELTVPSHRAQGEAVLRRLAGPGCDSKATVRFEVFSVAGGHEVLRGSAEVGLPVGEPEHLVSFPIDAGGSPLRFRVTLPAGLAKCVAAGWRALRILDSTDGPAVPGQLEPGSAEAVRLGAEAKALLLPRDWHPAEIYGRNVRNGKQGLEMPPRAEIWIRLKGAYRKIQGLAVLPDGRRAEVDPVVRVLYVKGAKLEVLEQSMVGGADRKYLFNAWSAEPDGWLVIVTGLSPQAPPVDLRIVAVEAAP